MPEFTFDGHGETTYPSSKDSAGVSVGTVEPGEIRDLDGPLDHWWRETADEDRTRLAAAQADDNPVDDEAGDDGGTPPAAAPAATTPASGQPAPPAVIPQPVPSASTEQQEG